MISKKRTDFISEGPETMNALKITDFSKRAPKTLISKKRTDFVPVGPKFDYILKMN